MNLATLLRYVDFKKGSPWDQRYYIMIDYRTLADQFGVGLCAVMNEQAIEELCGQCAGLLLPGSGTNIDPSYYGGAPLPEPEPVDEYALDAKVLEHFLKNGKPIFGICGGLQAINVFLGGTLKKVDRPEAHGGAPHPILIEKDSFVERVFGAERATVNSYHHWEIDRLAPDLTVVARSEDGVIEAVENRALKIFATQWHPEQAFHTGDPIEHRFFEHFIELCR